MRDISNQLECQECQFYREEDGYSWCTYWSIDEGDAVVEPDGYCNNALEKIDDGETD